MVIQSRPRIFPSQWTGAMANVQVRKFVTVVEEILHEGGPPPAVPRGRAPVGAGRPRAVRRRRAAVAAVVENPFAGRYVEEIAGLMDDLKPLGIEMARRLVDALGGDPKAIDGYGKGAIVGEAGELEHGALWHMPGGYAMRELLGNAKAIVPSAKKVGGVGSRLH